jgi:hypothetical protein
MAMHVHASFSELTGSMASQLECARRAGVNVVWFTEHDWRMSAHDYRTQVHFDSLLGEKEFGRVWVWKAKRSGAQLADFGGGLVSSPVSPNDPSSIAGALHVYAQAQGAASASYLYNADTNASRHNQRSNLTGTTITLDVLVGQASPAGYPELRIQLSNHPSSGGRPAGGYVLSYRFGLTGDAFTQGLLGVVPVPADAGTWTTVTLNPTDDIARLWPDMVAEDNSLVNLWLGVTSTQATRAEGWFDWLRFERSETAADHPILVQSAILERLLPLYPELAAYAGQEVSFYPGHLNWFGGSQYLHPYNGVGEDIVATKDKPVLTNSLVREMKQLGGTVSINHPFGASDEQEAVVGSADLARQKLAKKYLTYGAYGADLLEVAYAQRGGASIFNHLALWDTLSRNGLWMTGTGVSDNHDGLVGSGWLDDINRFTTSVWSDSIAPDSLLQTLQTGRAFCSELGSGISAVDVTVDGNPMGCVSVRPDLASRTAQVTVGGLPSGGSVQVVQGKVDWAGLHDLEPASNVVASLGAADFAGGTAGCSLDTSASSYVRVNVLDGAGRCVAVSNPVWMLTQRPPTSVPTERQAPDTTWS